MFIHLVGALQMLYSLKYRVNGLENQQGIHEKQQKTGDIKNLYNDPALQQMLTPHEIVNEKQERQNNLEEFKENG